MPKKFYVVEKVLKWGSLQMQAILPSGIIPCSMNDEEITGSIGFMPVFSNKAKMRKLFPNDSYMVVQKVVDKTKKS